MFPWLKKLFGCWLAKSCCQAPWNKVCRCRISIVVRISGLILNAVFISTPLNDRDIPAVRGNLAGHFSTPRPIDLTRPWIDRFTNAFSLLVGANHLLHALALDFGRCFRIVKNLGVEYEIVLPVPAVPCL